jgi:hypothetical protein
MKTKSTFWLAVLFAVSPMMALSPVSALSQDAPLPAPADASPLATPTRILDLALEGREELALTTEQAARLEAFRTSSLDRTADARAVVEAWREEVAAERDALADSVGIGLRERRRLLGAAARPTPEVREALRALREAGEAAVEELRGTLTVNQMSALREIARDEFPRLERAGAGRMRGMGQGFGPGSRPGFGPRSRRGFDRGFGPGFGPGYGPGLGPGFGPGFGPRLGPEEFRRRFRR